MKQHLFRFLLLFSMSIHYSYANIDSEIEAIKNAPIEERFKLMNAFKKKLIKMKEKERIEAMTKLSVKSKNPHAKKVLEVFKKERKQEQIRKQIENQHLETNNIVTDIETSQGGDDDN